MFSLIIGGDIMPSFQNLDYFINGYSEKIAKDDVREIFASADYRVFNLEVPITDDLNPIAKDGANFAIPTQAVKGLKNIGADVISVANNHIKDQGESGLFSTVDVLNKNDIDAFGFGKSFTDCCSTVYLKKDDMTIAVIACAETEFTIWSGKEAGAVPYHDYWTNKYIAEAKRISDCVVVLYHGGKEYYRYAAPYQVERCRLMVDSGADFVLCQHSHCISCFEEYKGGTILYGQGNCVFHQKNNKDITKEGLLVKIMLDGQNKSIEYIPVVLDEEDTLCLADNEKRKIILEEFNQRSEEIKMPGAVESLYLQFAQDKYEIYLRKLTGSKKINRLFYRIANKFKLDIYSKQDKLSLLNMVRNEAHRELFIEALKEDIKKDKA